MVVFDVKPWGDETDMAEMEKAVRSIQADGLLWGSSKLVPLAYGIKKLQIACVIEDDKVCILSQMFVKSIYLINKFNWDCILRILESLK